MIEIPEGVAIQVDGNKITAKGPRGELQKEFSKRVAVKVEGNKVEVTAGKALKGTVESLVRNMAIGVSTGYTRKLKVLYAHFPVSLEVKGKEILIKNFLGEKQPRKTVLASLLFQGSACGSLEKMVRCESSKRQGMLP